MKYEYNKELNFTGVYLGDDELELHCNGQFIGYVDLDNYEEYGKVDENDLFKIVVDNLCDDHYSDLIEMFWFQNKQFYDCSQEYYDLKYE